MRRKLTAGAAVAVAGVLATAAPAWAQNEVTAEAVQANLDNAFVLLCAVLVIFMQAGFALVETGFCRAKHAAHVVSEMVPMETPTPINPLGAKGIGESGTIGSTAAVQNAVVDALAHLGIRHLDMPATPERVWRAIVDPSRRAADDESPLSIARTLR